MPVSFNDTQMGYRFYCGTMPRIADSLESIAESLKKISQKATATNDQLCTADLSAEKILNVFQSYVVNDLVASSSDYVRDALREAGVSEAEFDSYGFGFLLNET